MNIGRLTKTKIAGADIAAHTIVKYGADADHVVHGAAATDSLIGVTTDIGASSGERCDVYHDGIVPVVAGAAFAVGALITSDANGKGVAAVSGNRVIGVAQQAATSADELIDVLLNFA